MSYNKHPLVLSDPEPVNHKGEVIQALKPWADPALRSGEPTKRFSQPVKRTPSTVQTVYRRPVEDDSPADSITAAIVVSSLFDSDNSYGDPQPEPDTFNGGGGDFGGGGSSGSWDSSSSSDSSSSYDSGSSDNGSSSSSC